MIVANQQIKRFLIHVAFWIFIFMYEMDYLLDIYSLQTAILLSLFELACYMTEAYVNLGVLIPRFAANGKWKLYISTIFLLLTGIYCVYLFSGLGNMLLAENTGRALLTFFINHALFILISFLYWYVTKYEKEKRRSIELENQKLKSELELLKSQLSPHFLFNTLNGIYSLILIDPTKAATLVDNLSVVLRYSIYSPKLSQVKLNEEVEVIQNYLLLQQARLQNGGTNIVFTTNADTFDHEVPPLLLLTIVENAFKHSDIFENENAFIKIILNVTNQEMLFAVSNSYQPKTSHPGIGLDNIKKQLTIAYPNAHQISIQDENHMYSIHIKLLHGTA